jgi:antitoxin ParD1/3/4
MMPTTEKLSITLPTDMARMIREKVAQGTYASNSEVIRDGLRMLQEADALREQKLAWMREKIEESRNDPRPPVPAQEVFDRLEAKYQRMIDAQGE